ncbi:MAG: tRNA-(ms[2]io[6]A)-hydroxylase [Deltaproteobacteria bacterium]|nr:tRNA-(ms[2]io[6]A)-hydroxylase [Deltaproteobacteria bacterium]
MKLYVPTDEAWVSRATSNVHELLVDHAHLEKKAASAAITLLFRYPDRPSMQKPLSRLAREEMRHFERVLGVLRARGLELCRLEPSRYAQKLATVVRSNEPDRMLDMLLVAAYIETRSAERMVLLGDALSDSDAVLAAMYRELVEAEDRHSETYLQFAQKMFPQREVEIRLDVIGQHEAEVVANTRMPGRLHG